MCPRLGSEPVSPMGETNVLTVKPPGLKVKLILFVDRGTSSRGRLMSATFACGVYSAVMYMWYNVIHFKSVLEVG